MYKLYPALLLIVGLITAASAQTEDTSCFHCHSTQVREFQKSIHFDKNISCSDCHGGDVRINGSIVSLDVMHINFTGRPARTNMTDFCSRCHGEVAKTYGESIHWQRLKEGRMEAATCTDCHGTHHILASKNPESLTYVENIPQTCADCHANQSKMQAWYYGIATDKFDTYKKSYHYKAYLSGGKVLATCSDCHENHDTRAASDPKSAVNQANLPATCGKTGCHQGANNAYIYGGKVHEGQSVYFFSIDAKKLVTYFYILMILFELTFTFGLIFLGITSNFEIRRRH